MYVFLRGNYNQGSSLCGYRQSPSLFHCGFSKDSFIPLYIFFTHLAILFLSPRFLNLICLFTLVTCPSPFVYSPSTAVKNRKQRSCLSYNPHSLATFKTRANLPDICLCFPWNNLLEHTGLNKWVWLALSAPKLSRDLSKGKRVRAWYRAKRKKIIDSGGREG